MPFVRVSRDKRGYETIYLVHTSQRRGRPAATRVLYAFRTPPGITVGRDPFDAEVRRTLEAQNPGVEFDWARLSDIPAPPPDVEHWRERRRAEKAAKQARRAEELEESAELEAAGTESPASEAGPTGSEAGPTGSALPLGPIDEIGSAGVADDDSDTGPDDRDVTRATDGTAIAADAQPTAGVSAAADGPGPGRSGKRRRRRRGARKPAGPAGTPSASPEPAPSTAPPPGGRDPGDGGEDVA